MRLGKSKDNSNDVSKDELERKVDAMMDPRREESSLVDIDKTKSTETPTEIKVTIPDEISEPIPGSIDIFDAAKTAPEIPGSHTEKATPKADHKIEVITDDTEPQTAPELENVADDVPEVTVDTAELEVATDEAQSKDDVTHDIKTEDDTKTLDEPLPDPLDDRQIDKAVDDITREESDKILAAEDAKVAKATTPKKISSKQKIKNFFTAWWANKWARWSTIVAVILLIVGCAVWPTTRYFALNTMGIRGSASIRVVDAATGMPLKNVTVAIGSTEVKTNGDGVSSFRQIKLGSQKLIIDRVAFAQVEKNITLGWGSNPLPDVKLKAVGARYTFNLTDYLSQKPITNAEIVSGDASAFADKSGQAVLTLDNPDTDTISVSIKSKEYRTEKLNFAATTKTAFEVQMAPGTPIVYISKQSGKYDLYKVDVDGKNKQLLLAGSGSERKEISVATSPDGTKAALVSSRMNKRDESKYLLDTLTLIDIKSGQTKSIDDAQSIRLIDWVSDDLSYVATYAAPSAGNSQRQRLVSYNTEDSARHVLATSDYFNGMASIAGQIYFSVASSDPSQKPGLSKIKIDGSGKQSILDKEVWTIVRMSESILMLETPDGWYEYRAGDSTAHKGNAPVDSYASRQYVAAPGGSKNAWVDTRDGKGVLLTRDQKSNDRTIEAISGLTGPIRWLNKSTIAYRVSSASETADYVVNIDGGSPKKISDVTSTTGLAINY